MIPSPCVTLSLSLLDLGFLEVAFGSPFLNPSELDRPFCATELQVLEDECCLQDELVDALDSDALYHKFGPLLNRKTRTHLFKYPIWLPSLRSFLQERHADREAVGPGM